MGRIIAIANHKGGVGKTTTAINLSASLAHFGRHVLLIDIDPQGNSSRGLGVDVTLISKSIFEVMLGTIDVKSAIRKTPLKKLELLSSKLLLASMDVTFASFKEPYLILRNVLEPIRDKYDYIIIDCPPSLGILTLNALNAANTILIPVQCEYFAMDAISSILATVANVQTTTNPNLGIEGFLMTMYDAKTSLGTEIASQVRGLFKENTFLTQIPRNVSIPESNSKGLPVTIYKPSSSGALAYFSLAKEVIDHEER
ncbi:MAG: AAA family ATPase [Bacilli bacterium]|nr:AAA family ATPase [Bacilli bacterium]